MDEKRMEMLEEAIEESIEVYNNCTTGSPEREKEAKNLKQLIDALNELNNGETDREDKRERRKIEKEKNEKNAKVEEIKARKDWRDRLQDVGMIILKGGVATIGQLILLKVLIEFEENGTLRSKAAKDFKILNPLNWIR